MLKVHSYESMGTYDGPGLRLVVFLQSCNFRCLYCANPDTIENKGGKPTDMQEIIQMAERERPFFGRKGGVTFSGGEPLLQADELLPLIKELHNRGIHVCIDSNGSINSEAARKLLLEADLCLLDIKHIDNGKHKYLTGRDVYNSLDTAQFLQDNGKDFWLRHVLVPDFNSSDSDLQRLGEHFSSFSRIQRVEILPYHRLGVHKYEALGWEYKLKDVKEPERSLLDHCKELLQKYFQAPVVVN